TVDVAADVAADAAGNNNTAATQFSVENDQTAPILLSILRNTPATEQTDADSLVFAIAFEEAVTNVTAEDFVISGTSATGVLAGSDASYLLTVSGGDLASLNGRVGLDVAAGQDIADLAGNTLNGAEPATDETYNVINDTEAPTVVSILRDLEGEVTNSDTLGWTVRFSEDVTGIDTADFVISGTTGTITNVSPLAVALPPSVTGGNLAAPFAVSSSSFTVMASGGDLASYNGVVALSFAAAQNITDEAGNALINTTPTGANEASYTLDNTAPTVSITTAAMSPVRAPFEISISFSEAVSGFSIDDIRSGGDANDFDAQNLIALSELEYTATIFPGYGANLVIEIPAGAARDEADNENTAATPLLITHDQNRTLTLQMPGVGAGRVTSSPAGVDCTASCATDFTYASVVTLTATPEPGSSFAGWQTGDCREETETTCEIGLKRDATVTARFVLDNPPAGQIVAATLPGARSGYVGGPALSAFLSVVSSATTPAQSCRVTAPSDAPFTLNYSQIDASGNPTGPSDPLFDIAAGGTLSFVLGMTPSAQTGDGGYQYLPMVVCENASLDPIVGVSSVSLNIGPAPTPDILSINATISGDGVIRILPPDRIAFMTASAINIGVGDGTAGPGQVTLTVSVDTGAVKLPVAVDVCQINASSVCITPRSSNLTTVMNGSDPLFFAAFVRDVSAAGIPFDPANSRVFLRFRDGNGVLRSSTSAAVMAPTSDDDPFMVSSMPSGRWSVLLRQPDGVWPGLTRADLFVMEGGAVLVDDGQMVSQLSIAALGEPTDGRGLFLLSNEVGIWMSNGAIHFGPPWAPETGHFWGVRDMRGDSAESWLDYAGRFGEDVVLTEAGELRGRIGSCSVYADAPLAARDAATVILSGCSHSGEYLGVLNIPVNDNGEAVLLIANANRGWRLPQ
ncbi:Ig-like domain-containing protein, partial [Hyphobacterium sp. HN65]